MKKLFALAAAALILSACSSTWSGAKTMPTAIGTKPKKPLNMLPTRLRKPLKKAAMP